jgi:hypothetical protein
MSTVELFYAGTISDDLDLQDRQREISRMLHNNDCEVTFTKVDGTVRTMPCTLRADALPPQDPAKITESKNKAPNYNNLSVWCLDKKEWRSFRVANVQKVKVMYGTMD